MKAVKIAAWAALLSGAAAVHAAPVAIVNLCAGNSNQSALYSSTPTTPQCTSGANAGTHSSQTANPVTVMLAAGGYSVNVVGAGVTAPIVVGANNTATSSLFTAYSIQVNTSTNPGTPVSFSDDGWTFTANGVTQGHLGQSSPVFATAALALAAYSPGGSNALVYKFYLPTAQTVQFQLDDMNSPYFADDTGGVSLAISQSVPEPVTVGLFGMGLVALGASRRRRSARA